MQLAYEEMIDFIAGDTIAFRPSESSKTRVGDLIYKSKNTGLSIEEKSELEHYLQLEHLMRMAKARSLHLAPSIH